MDLRFSAEEDAFRKEVRAYLDDLLHGDFADDPGAGRTRATSTRSSRSGWPGSVASGADGWTCVGWPTEYGGRGLPLDQQVIFYEEYARAGGPGRLGHIGEGLIGPTLIALRHARAAGSGSCPRIRPARSCGARATPSPNAGSDLANVQTRAVLAATATSG